MRFTSLFAAAAFVVHVKGHPVQSTLPDAIHVQTSSGLIHGFVHQSAPHTRQFLGIPFALPPTNSLRWLPPQSFNSNASVKGNDIGPACPQQPLRNAWVFSPNGGNVTESFPEEFFSEDCLTLNVWTPESPTSALPVIVWFFGGGFTQGGTNAKYFNPQSWVERTQEHIVVTVNFRSNVFGFPNAKDLQDQNLGLLDQRLGLEWVRSNIAKFGGDPARIVNWGESSGAIGVDFLNFAFAEDPITSGSILDSTTAIFPLSSSVSYDTTHSNFTYIASQVGCSLAKSKIDCMRQIDWRTIEGAIEGVLPGTMINFMPVIDNRIVFPNYTARYEAGAAAKIPALIGTNEHELYALVPHIPGQPFDAEMYDLAANQTFLASAAKSSRLRESLGLTTYRYRFDGDFSNLSPPRYPGAFHTTELPLIFGTAAEFHGPSTVYEEEVGKVMQDIWLSFANDPQCGMKKDGWVGTYRDGQAVLLGGKTAAVQVIDVQELDQEWAESPMV